MLPDLISCCALKSPQTSNQLSTQRNGIKLFWQPISPQSDTSGSKRGLCLVAVKSPLILYSTVNRHVDFCMCSGVTPRHGIAAMIFEVCFLSVHHFVWNKQSFQRRPLLASCGFSSKQRNPPVATKASAAARIQQFYKSTWSELPLRSPRQNIRGVWVAVSLLFKSSAGYPLSWKTSVNFHWSVLRRECSALPAFRTREAALNLSWNWK